MRKLSTRLLVVLLAALVLAACHKGKQEQLGAESATPQATVQNAIDDIQAGNFDRLMQHLLPPAEYKQMRAQWSDMHRRDIDEVSNEDRQRFARQMKALTEPGAKAGQFKKLEPMLDAWDSKYKQRLPMMVGIFRIMVGTKITQSDTMSAEQKSQARGVLDALAEWAQGTNWGDKAKARQAVGIVVDTARALKLKTLDQAYRLSYEEAMQRYGTAWNGIKQLLDVYGLSLDTILDSATLKTLEQTGDTARVEVDFTILGKPLTSTIDMVRKDKRWYAADFLEHWHEEQARLARAGSAAGAASAAPAASAPATAASAPATATATQ